MENTWKNYNVHSMRHKNWDYSNSGWYFITICTQSRINYFAKINNQKIHLKKVVFHQLLDPLKELSQNQSDK